MGLPVIKSRRSAVWWEVTTLVLVESAHYFTGFDVRVCHCKSLFRQAKLLFEENFPQNKMDDFFTPEETARRLKVQVSTVRRWLRDGTLQGHKLGRLWRISSAELSHLAGVQAVVTPEEDARRK